MANTDTKLATIIERLSNIQGDIADIKEFNKTVDCRTTNLEVNQSEIRTKISLFAGMQGAFSVVVGAVATYLGVKS